MKTAHAQLITKVNSASIKKEVIDGEDHYRIPSATLPDNHVLNSGLYLAEEIDASYKSLEGTAAPLGHPKIGGQFVPATNGQAINKHWVGAWNERVRREGGRVLLDKVVNIRVANQTDKGRELIQAIEKQAPIHTSTGLMLEMEVANGESNGKPYTWIARNMRFDHDAILLDEPGAATPAEGVGMFVNAAGDEVEVMVANIDVDEIDWMVEDVARQTVLTKHEAEKNGLMDKIRQAIKSAIGGAQTEAPVVNQAKAPEGDMTEEQMKALLDSAMQANSEKLDALAERLTAIETNQTEQGEAVTALKANADAAAAAEKAGLVEQVKAQGFEDADIEGMSVNAMQKIVAKAQPSHGFHLNAAYSGQAKAEDTNTLPE